MPLTEKGKKIMSHMTEQYGAKKGKEVFYASQNKGTIDGTHKTSEANSPAWLTGFVKGANALGVTDATDVQQLLKIAQRLHIMNTQGEAFERGYNATVKSAQVGQLLAKGLTRFWKPMLGGAAALGAGSMLPGFARRMGMRPNDMGAWTINESQQHADQMKAITDRMRNITRQPGDYAGPGGRGYFSNMGGYYTTPR